MTLPNTNCYGGTPSGRGSLVPGSQDKVARGLLKVTPVQTRERALHPDGGIALHLRAAGRLASSDAQLVRGPVVLKSVHCLLALDWLAEHMQPSVLIVMRNPLNVLASLRDLDMRDQDRDLSGDSRVRERVMEPRGIAPPPPTADALERAAWQLGLFMTVLTDAAERHVWPVVWHEDVCVDLRVSFERLGKEMGVGWSHAGDEFVRSSDRPGRGFSLRREASQQPDSLASESQVNKMPTRSTPCSTCSPRRISFGPRPGLDGIGLRPQAIHHAQHGHLVGPLLHAAEVPVVDHVALHRRGRPLVELVLKLGGGGHRVPVRGREVLHHRPVAGDAGLPGLLDRRRDHRLVVAADRHRVDRRARGCPPCPTHRA